MSTRTPDADGDWARNREDDEYIETIDQVVSDRWHCFIGRGENTKHSDDGVDIFEVLYLAATDGEEWKTNVLHRDGWWNYGSAYNMGEKWLMKVTGENV